MSQGISDRDDLLDTLTDLVGAKHVVTDPDTLAPRLIDWRKRYQGRARCLVEPGTARETADIVRACAATGTPIVPQGGHTGLVGGSTPLADGRSVILSTHRLNRIRDMDPRNNTMTVEAGCILADLQAAAHDAGRFFPLSLAAEGTCQIGGNLATNAGGLNVLRYGTARDQVLGLEVVLPDGRLWDGLRRLRKDNTGYDLKQLFIGAEGTLGVITAAVLRLHPQPRETATAFAAVPDVDAALRLFDRVQGATAESCVSFELIARRGVDLAVAHVQGAQDPIADRHPWYVLVEVAGGTGDGGLRTALEGALGMAFEAGEVADAAIAESAGQRAAFWHLREAVVEGQRHEGASIKHDIAVPVSSVPAFLDRALPAVEDMIPGVRPVPFGHLGDGNLHFNLTQPEGMDPQAFLAEWERVNAAVHDVVAGFGGTISAEHGIGQMKVAENARFKPGVEIEMMRALKRTFDPQNIMNPGKVVPPG
jgi:D-lactate dehydrogenase (cytochrome)